MNIGYYYLNRLLVKIMVLYTNDIFLKYKNSSYMDFDYFDQQGPNNTNASQLRQQDTNQDEFVFHNQQSDPNQIQSPVNYSYSPPLMTHQEEDEIARRVREEQDKINQQLRAKANEEYQLKQKRKQQGARQIEEFFDKKDRQKKQRKEENARIQQETKQKIKSQSLKGWKKVAANVPLKQGEHKGSKDVNRMREALIRKRDDEK